MIYSKLESSASTHDFEEDYSTPEYELYEDDDGMEFPMLRNAMMSQLPLHMTHTLVLR